MYRYLWLPTLLVFSFLCESATALTFREIRVRDVLVVTDPKGVLLYYFNSSDDAMQALTKEACSKCVPIKRGQRFEVARIIEPACFSVNEKDIRCEYNLVVSAVDENFPIQASVFAINALSLEGEEKSIEATPSTKLTVTNLAKWRPVLPAEQLAVCHASMLEIRDISQRLRQAEGENPEVGNSVQEIMTIIENVAPKSLPRPTP